MIHDITPGGENFERWQRQREETAFPAFREETRKKLQYGTRSGLCPTLGEYVVLDLKIPKDVFPEEYAAVLNIINSLGNKLIPGHNYPTDIKPHYGLWTDKVALPAGTDRSPLVTPFGTYRRDLEDKDIENDKQDR